MCLSSPLTMMQSQSCTKHSFIYYFLCTALFLMNHVLTQERPSREGYFKGPYSYALLPNSISLNNPITLSFRSCSFGELLSQEGKNGDYLRIELADSGRLKLKWKVDGLEDTLEYSSSNLKNNVWHNVELREISGSVLLKIDQLSSQTVSNSTTRTNLLFINLNNDYPNLYIGKNYTGCVLEGSSIVLNDTRVMSSDVTWGRCPLPNSRSCDGYEADACFTQPCHGSSTCVSTSIGFKCQCTARFSGEKCDVDEGALCSRPEFNLCENNGECVEDSIGNSTFCVCRPNFAGHYCETPTNGSLCEQNTCNGGTCIAHGNSIRCICPPGFAGDNCSLNINECESNPCWNNGTCIDEIGSYFCVCRDTGYKGSNCEENINECLEQNPCSSGSTCFDNYGSYVCICPPGKGGKDCDVPVDDCSSHPCHNGGTCIARNKGYDCRCPLGFEGYSCETNVDDCAIAMCPPNSHCIDGINRFICECDQGFTGNPPNCSPLLSRIIESPSPICHTSSCFNGGTCLTEDGKNSTTCICAAGFTGHLCEARCVIQCNETGSCSPCDANACASNPCLNKRSCRSLNNHSYICDCLPGWTGRDCDTRSVRASRLEDCQSKPCLHGVCSNHRCVCDVGYTGEHCESPISACESMPCLNGGTCERRMLSGYICICPRGFDGANCEENIDDCVGVTCPTYQVCHDLVNGHQCSCPDGFAGSDCSIIVDSCASQPCVRGNCLNGAGTYTCLCPPGFTGKHCDTDLNLCDPSPCVFGICQNSNGSYKCYCQPGYTGHNCNVEFNECLSNPCHNNGTCQNLVNDYNCLCSPGFSGKECEIDIDECASSPCINGATCYDSINQYTCACLPGYNGTRCETDINECESSPCFNVEGAMCVDLVNGFHCDCGDSGFSGVFCEKNIDDCFSDPCINGGSCEDQVKNYTCHCFEGYKGVNCQIDINECESNPCQNGATCFQKSNSSLYEVNYLGRFPSFSYKDASGYFCECQLGFSGDNCETNIDDCENHDCVNGTCIDGINSYHCECIPGFEAKDCSIDINECERFHPCQNNATCVDLIADYSCKCQFGFGGKNCQIELLGCRNDPCENNGECVPYLDKNQEHQFRCDCPVGFAGRTCELITIVSFKNSSSMEVAHAYKTNSYFYTYSLRFQFRTTLSEGVLVHSSDTYNNLFIILYLQDGSINLGIQNYGILKKIKEDERAPSRNDGLWKDVSINITPNSANLSVSNWIQTDAVSSENIGNLNITTFGGGLLPSSFAHHQTFIGCMREIYLNDQLIIPRNSTLKGTSIGCDRKEQCLEDTCSKIGYCKDYWFSYSCLCPRPYYGSTCQYSVTPATFGYQNVQSWAKVEVPEMEKPGLTRSTNVTLFLRTRQADGFILYLGPNLFGDQDQYGSESQSYSNTAFVAVFLENGFLKVATGSPNGTIEIIMMEKKLNNGDYHFVKVFRNSTLLSLSINETTNHESIPENPLKTDVIFIGGLPKHSSESRSKRQIDLGTKINAGVYNTHSWENITFFKGIIQDFRINDMLIDMYPSPSSYSLDDKAPEVFPSPVETNSVSEGVLSDNPCPSSPCTNGGTCIDTWNSFSCECSEGYRGTNCSEKEPCFIHQCPVNSVCRNLPIGYECLTDAALKGDSLLKYKSRFLSNVTSNCISLRFRTQTPGGTLLHIVTNGFNPNHLTITINDSVIIQWKFGYNENIGNLLVGTNVTDGDWHNVTIFLNETTLKAVMDDSDTLAEYTSVVSFLEIVEDADFYVGGNTKPDGFYRGCLDDIRIGEVLLPFFTRDALQNDESPNRFDLVSSSEGLHIGCVVCWDELCEHNGECRNATTDFGCECPHQYSGQFCNKDTDECLDNPCEHGSCENIFGSFSCHCEQFYTGSLCSEEVNLCKELPCQNGGKCTHSIGAYFCECTDEYTGYNCTQLKVEKCENRPCQNGATCLPTLRQDNKEFKCECKDGYEGERCETIIDYCSSSNPCVNGSCINSPEVPGRKFVCMCNPGYEGDLCDTEINRCRPNPCLNGGKCEREGLENYVCECETGFQGYNCEDDKDECLNSNLCKNNATCFNLVGSYKCNCSEEFAPPHCVVKNPCLTHNCENNGECLPQADETNLTSSPICKCASGFNGTHCEEKLIIPSTTDTLALAVGLSLAIICVICVIVAVVIFLRIAKKKRATRGTYSPSRQEMFGSRVEMNHVMKPPPEERLI